MDNHKYTVKENPGLIRDGYSKAIINTDQAMLAHHRQRKQITNTVQSLTSDVNGLKDDVNEIKQLLKVLIDQHNK